MTKQLKKNRSYWQKRFEELEKAQNNKGATYLNNLDDQFRRATSSIETQIETWYNRFALNNEVSYIKAKQMLNAKELKEFKWTVEEYIKYGQTNAITGEWMKELENASARVHISRLEALKVQMQHQVEVLYGNQSDDIDRLMSTIYTDGYYHTAYEIQKGLNVGFEFAKLDTDRISKVLSNPWTLDGKNFSARIWGNKATLVNNLYTNLTQSIIRGEAPDKAIRNISRIMNTSRKNAGRLVMTESAFFASASQKDCFTELDVEQFEIVATLDMHTSEICQGLDGQVFKMSDWKVGLTAPPFHVYCRTTTVPYFEDNYTERVARDHEGKTYYVDGDMNYKDWHKEYVESNPEAVLKEKKIKNYAADKNQYKDYQEKLGAKYLPKSFDEFQNMKYGTADEYGILKAQAKGMSYYNKAVANEPEITEHVKKIAKSSDMDMAGLKYRIKEKDSYIRKIRDNYALGDNQYEVKDIIRYTYTANPDSMVGKSLKAIDTHKNLGYNTIEIKNYWLKKFNPYNGVNTVVTAPNGQKFEIQYHTPASYKIKDEIHDMYEEWREQPIDSDRAKELRRKMFMRYEGVTVPTNIERVK